jgi:hypothetical protein
MSLVLGLVGIAIGEVAVEAVEPAVAAGAIPARPAVASKFRLLIMGAFSFYQV